MQIEKDLRTAGNFNYCTSGQTSWWLNLSCPLSARFLNLSSAALPQSRQLPQGLFSQDTDPVCPGLPYQLHGIITPRIEIITPPANQLIDLLKTQYPAFEQTQPLQDHVRQAVRMLTSCHTSALGGHVESCRTATSSGSFTIPAVTGWAVHERQTGRPCPLRRPPGRPPAASRSSRARPGVDRRHRGLAPVPYLPPSAGSPSW